MSVLAEALVKTFLLYHYYLLLGASGIPLLTYLFTYSSQETILPCLRAQ